MEENYPPSFTYQDFGRQLKMEFFNASWIADLVKDSGAKYALFCNLFISAAVKLNSCFDSYNLNFLLLQILCVYK